jgi:hypothetical protein
VQFEARKLMLYANACGTYLSRLKGNHADRISARVLRGKTFWTILPPVKAVTDV